MNPVAYIARLSVGKTVLWCYLLWYVTTVVRYFDPAPAIWLNSAGISLVIGVALLLSVAGPGANRPDGWQTFRLFLMPFAVSSFSALIKGRGFVLIFPPSVRETAMHAGVCAAFLLGVAAIKQVARTEGAPR